MNVSTKGRYGLRAIMDIAKYGQERPVTLSAISRRQQISEGYLEQLMSSMKKAGLVKSSRGAQGGYSLACEPDKIEAGDIFRALEGPLALTACIGEAEEQACFMQESCGSRFIWEELQKAVSRVLASYTLADLLAREKN
ncbi:MAG: Rrf2 family transcriptional regulator [Firmicutes bacterium]|nr:Rrf2 family transcriptional regulator [Bacillota bacterium]